MSILAHKNYLVDRKPFMQHFYARNITFIAVRTVGTQGLLVFNEFMQSLDLDDTSDNESDSEDELGYSIKKIKTTKKDFVPPTPEEFKHTCIIQFIKTISITTCLRSLEYIALQVCTLHTVGKLVKDVSKSAIRKFIRTGSRYTAARLIIKTNMQASCLAHFAIFLIEELQYILEKTYKVRFFQPRKKLGDNVNEKNISTSRLPFLDATIKNASRSSLAIVTGSVGASIGTIIRPGLGTFIGASIGDVIAYAI